MDTKNTVFISYRSSDIDIAQAIHERLRNGGIYAWFDREQIRTGSRWAYVIQDAANIARIVLPIVTPSWRESAWTRFETYGAEQVIPLLCSGEWDGVAPGPLLGCQFFDCRDLANSDFDGLIAEINQRLNAPAKSKEDRVSYLPYMATPNFVGRDDMLLRIHECFWRRPTTALTQSRPQAICGLGGVGKTTVVREYIERFWRAYDDILWIQAGAEEVVGEMARLGLMINAFSKPSGDAELDARRTIHELQNQKPRLLVFDSADDESSIFAWLPKSGGCRSLITSRFRGWSVNVERIDVDSPSPEVAAELLLVRSGCEPTRANRQAAEELARELGCLPLALEQAAAVIVNQQRTIAEYIDDYHESQQLLLSRHVLGSTNYPRSVATTWHTTMSLLSKESQDVLAFASMFAPDRIPLQLIQKGLAESGDNCGAAADADSESLLSTRLKLSQLVEYSLLKLHRHYVSLHRLVQAVIRDSLEQEKAEFACGTAARALLGGLKKTPGNVDDDVGPMIHHVEALLTMEPVLSRDPEIAAELFRRAGSWLVYQASQHHRARPLLEAFLRVSRLFEIDPKILGPGLPALASVAWYDGNYEAALEYAEEAQQLSYEAELPPEVDLKIAQIRGILYNDLGRYAESERVFNEALAICDQELPSEVHMRIWLLNEKAWLLRDMGRLAESESLFRQNLDHDATRDSGHHAGITHNNLAYVYESWNRLEDADRHNQIALETIDFAIGNQNKYYAHALNVRGDVLRKRGKLGEAIEVLNRAIDVQRSSIAEMHPHAALIDWSLAETHLAAGSLDEGLRFSQRALAVREAVFPKPHPKIASSLFQLSRIFKKQGDMRRGSELHQQAETMLRDHAAREAAI